MLVDYKSCRYRQLPFVISVGLSNVDPEFAVHFFQVVWEAVNQIQRTGELVVFIEQNIELKVSAGNQLLVLLRCLRSNSNQSGRNFTQLFYYAVKSIQLYIAVRSPHAAEKRNNQWPRLSERC